MVYVTAIHLVGGTGHEHIGGVRWLDSANSTSNTMTRAQAVEFLREGNQLVVADAKGPVTVGVVEASPPYIRTVADGRATDNLLALPRY